MSIDEFAEVGSIVQDFASEEATVVVGTAIDPELNDELRVTVVATGLLAKGQQPVKLVSNSDENIKADGTTDYQKLDRPTVIRQQNGGEAKAAGSDMDYLDIPAFLRKQAD